MLYVGNLSEKELPRVRVIGWMATLGIGSILLGTLSLPFPGFGFRKPLSLIMPQSLLEGGGLAKLAQAQPILGQTSPRPSAPFAYTNAWGNSLSLLLVWLTLAALFAYSRPKRLTVWLLIAVSLIPIVYSLNRAMWIGLGICVVVVTVRLAIRGQTAVMRPLIGAVAVGVVVLTLSPLQGMVQQRIDTGHSNEIRRSLAAAAVDAAKHSPVIGYGTTRQTVGSDASIAIGPTPECQICGYRDIGSTGQVWLLLIAQGFLGSALYLGFWVRSLWAYRSDWSPVGIAGTLVVLLNTFYAFFYTALQMPLTVTMLSLALLWRNKDLRRAG